MPRRYVVNHVTRITSTSAEMTDVRVTKFTISGRERSDVLVSSPDSGRTHVCGDRHQTRLERRRAKEDGHVALRRVGRLKLSTTQQGVDDAVLLPFNEAELWEREHP